MKMPLTLWSGVILSKCLIKDEFIERKTKKQINKNSFVFELIFK